MKYFWETFVVFRSVEVLIVYRLCSRKKIKEILVGNNPYNYWGKSSESIDLQGTLSMSYLNFQGLPLMCVV